jgi:two-component system, chemotaxis family, protein-glutamate methylesterase/glutaminase
MIKGLIKYEAIVVGGSSGGMNALIKILKGIPKDFSLPFIVVLHRLKYYKSSLEYLIQDKVLLKIKEIEEKEKIKSGIVYIAPSDYHVLIEEDKTFSLCSSEPVLYSRPSIDVTFISAAKVYGEKLLGIILTGANQDGSEGLRFIAEKGGLTIVQHPEEAEMSEMPASALSCAKNSIVLKLNEINYLLLSL